MLRQWKYVALGMVLIVGMVLVHVHVLQSSQSPQSPQNGGAPANPQLQNVSGPFSKIGAFVGEGLSGTWDNKINGPDTTKQQLNRSEHPLMTYYGHSVPLLDEVRQPGDFDSMPITPHSLNPKCAPECCPSPYSCDHGCLCVDQDGLRDAAWAPAKN